jgi:mannose-6-phosphate isomerase-like protein (cupin superfamily)
MKRDAWHELQEPQAAAGSFIEEVVDGAAKVAVILRAGYVRDGITFLTPNDYSQQLGYMKRPAGYRIEPHVHNPVHRDVMFTREVLFIKSGRVRVDFYDDGRRYLESRVLRAGDVILLAAGGHGFEMLEPAEMIEVKQGPYAGDADKTRFEAVASERIRVRG